MEGGDSFKKINVSEDLFSSKPHKKHGGGSRPRRERENISQLRPLTVKELLLEKLKKYKKEKSRKNRNLGAKIQPSFQSQTQDSSLPSLTTSFSQPPKQARKPNIQRPKINHHYGRTEIEPPEEYEKANHPTFMDYGNLKNGVKPTYRQFLKNKTMKRENQKNKIKVEVEKKFNVGRNHTQKKVGVFIKSDEMRRKINDEKVEIQRSNIKTVKNYLKTQNLIKYGSEAPNELLREIFSSSKLCGDVFNINGQSLVHNYMNHQD